MIYLSFINIEKAFDNIDWAIMFTIVMKLDLLFKNKRFVYNLYKNKNTQIKINEKSINIKVRREVKQGCPLSPLLFNYFIKKKEYESNEREIRKSKYRHRKGGLQI